MCHRAWLVRLQTEMLKMQTGTIYARVCGIFIIAKAQTAACHEKHVSALIIPAAAVWVHACCWGRMDGIHRYLLTPPIFQVPWCSLKMWGWGGGWVGFNLSHLLPWDWHPPHRPQKTPPLSLCLSVSGTVMLILGFTLPSKLRGLHYWPRCIYTKIRPSPPSLPLYLNFPKYVMKTQITGWLKWCLLSHPGRDNLRLFMNKQKSGFQAPSESLGFVYNMISLLNEWTVITGSEGYIQACFSLHIHPLHWRPVVVWYDGVFIFLWGRTGVVMSWWWQET